MRINKPLFLCAVLFFVAIFQTGFIAPEVKADPAWYSAAVNYCDNYIKEHPSAKNYDSSDSDRKADKWDKQTCINWVTQGHNDKPCNSSTYENIKACEFGKEFGSSSASTSTTTTTPAADPATPTGPAGPTTTTTPPGGAGTGTEAPTQSFGGDVTGRVSKDLNTSTIKLTADDLKKAGIVVPDTSGTKLVAQTLNAVYSLAATVAVIVIIAAGFIIITADGDAQKLATGRKAIIYACVGLIIIASAFIITGIIQAIGSK